jgi:hypothetical protein
VRTWGVASAVDVLAFNAQKQYPESEFAAWYKGLQVEPGQGVEFKNYRGKY